MRSKEFLDIFLQIKRSYFIPRVLFIYIHVCAVATTLRS